MPRPCVPGSVPVGKRLVGSFKGDCGTLLPQFGVTACWCGGICDAVMVTFSAPPFWPRLYGLRPGPWLACIGARPRRSGSANVVCPLPPYVVPKSENRALFCAIGKSCPSHRAQPRGLKFPQHIRIPPRNGSDIIRSEEHT